MASSTQSGTPAFSAPELNELKHTLVTACHILDREGITDGYGHVSARVPGTTTFLTIANVSPGLASADRLILMDCDGKSKEMEKSDIIVQARNWFGNVGILSVFDAWQVIQAPTVIETTETSTDEPTDGSALGEIKIKSLNVEKASYFKDEEVLFFWNR